MLYCNIRNFLGPDILNADCLEVLWKANCSLKTAIILESASSSVLYLKSITI